MVGVHVGLGKAAVDVVTIYNATHASRLASHTRRKDARPTSTFGRSWSSRRRCSWDVAGGMQNRRWAATRRQHCDHESGRGAQRHATPVWVAGRSDHNLVTAVQNELNVMAAKAAAAGQTLPMKPLSVAIGVTGGLGVRPIDALHQLAKATRPLIPDDVYHWYRHWAWLRYLGIFDVSGANLGLSAAGLRVRANQRRVMSEEVGVGFGILVAEQWCRHLGATGPITVVDVDLALYEGRMWVELHAGRLRVGGRQPDYLMVYPDPSNPQAVTFKTVECKNTASAANVTGQLARAATQLASLSLGGSPPQGIAVDTISDRAGVRYRAIDPDEEAGADTLSIAERELQRARQPADVARSDNGVISLPAGEFIANSLLVGMGTLADYAGNLSAAAEFLPPVTRERLQRVPRDRTIRETEDGQFVGVEQLLPTPGGEQLRAFSGVAASVDAALSTGSIEAVRAAQEEFQQMRPSRTPAGEPRASSRSEDPVVATSSDGSVLILNR